VGWEKCFLDLTRQRKFPVRALTFYAFLFDVIILDGQGSLLGNAVNDLKTPVL
jgi:hypothetical protein